MASLGEAYPQELQRLKEVLVEYESIPQGAFGAANIRATIIKAEKAWNDGDAVAMLGIYQEMLGIE